MAFAYLPNEIFYLIFTPFCQHCYAPEPPRHSTDRRTLRSLCLVSRRFRAVAQSILYHEFVLGSESRLPDHRFVSFRRTVTARLDLAACVKRMLIRASPLASIAGKSRLNTHKRAVSAVGTQEPHRDLIVGDLFTTIIAKLPNLEYCSFHLNGRYPLRHGGDSPDPRDRAGIAALPLRTIDISLDIEMGTTKPEILVDWALRTLLGKSSLHLETLNFYNCPTLRHIQSMSRLPKLKTLRVRNSDIGYRDLKLVVHRCPGLSALVYVADGRLELDGILKCLEGHRATLRSLHLDCERRSSTLDTYCGQSKGPWTVRDFTVLQHFSLSANELYESRCRRCWQLQDPGPQILVELLPASIESLYLPGNVGSSGPSLAEGLLNVAEAVSRREFPRLRRVRCCQAHQQDCSSVVSAFAAVGVDFGFDCWPRHWTPPSYMGDGFMDEDYYCWSRNF